MKADTMNIELPPPDCTYADHSYPAYSRKAVERIVADLRSRAASEPGEVARLADDEEFTAFDAHWSRPGYAIDLTRKPSHDSSGFYVSPTTDAMFCSWLARAGMATSPASEAQAGWVMVPREINENMHVAAVRTIRRCTGNDDFPLRVWRAMLAAARLPASSPVAAEGQKAVERRANQSPEGTASELWRIGLLEWGVAGWRDEVQNRPLVNIHRERLDTFWRTVIRKAGGDPDALVGPAAPATPTASSAPKAEGEAAIDMVLHCPKCGRQHIDAPDGEPHLNVARIDEDASITEPWDNPPHRSHLCHGCGHIWRPADVPTNGVAAVKTTGKADSPIAAPVAQAAAGAWQPQMRELITKLRSGDWSLRSPDELACMVADMLERAIPRIAAAGDDADRASGGGV